MRLPRAAASGYPAVVLWDWDLFRLDRAGPEHAANARRLQEEARRHGLDLIPCVMPVGDSLSVLEQDLNLAEGLPLRDALFICEVSPGAGLWAFSGMFDPMHEAVEEYYLVNGSWAGSWEGLSPEVGIVNWAYQLAGANLGWSAERGHQQVPAGYYDQDEWVIGEWLAAGKGLSRDRGRHVQGMAGQLRPHGGLGPPGPVTAVASARPGPHRA